MAQISVEDWLRAVDMYPTTEFTPRPALMDPIEAEHLHAMIVANMLERQREANAFKMLRELNMDCWRRANRM